MRSHKTTRSSGRGTPRPRRTEALGFPSPSRTPGGRFVLAKRSRWCSRSTGATFPGFNYEHCGGLGNADAVLDHSIGTVNPQADFENNGISGPLCGLLGGVRGGVIRGDGSAEPLPPMKFAVYLNQAVRFDRAGAYRVYVRSRHRLLGHQGDELLPPLISNILEFDIVERDQAWEAKTLEEAIGVAHRDLQSRQGTSRQ